MAFAGTMDGMSWRLYLLATFVAAAGGVAAGRDLSADAYNDKLRGMWLGEILGNYAGRPSEGKFTTAYPDGNPAEAIDWGSFIHTGTWDGDDDTGLEYLAQSVLTSVAQPTDQRFAHCQVPLTSSECCRSHESGRSPSEGMRTPRMGPYGSPSGLFFAVWPMLMVGIPSACSAPVYW